MKKICWLSALLAPLVLLTGCTDTPPRLDGPDMSFLNAPLIEEPSTNPQMPLLPLVPGATWKMISVTGGKKFEDTIVVTGPLSESGVTGTEIETRRNGKRWRREVYQQNSEGSIFLAGMQDETSDLMKLDPPVPIARHPCREGDNSLWRGNLGVGNLSLPAMAYSRVSARETVITPFGHFKTYRIDTMIITKGGSRDETRFPSVRWFAPGAGFVRRGFVERGAAAFSEIISFSLPSN